MLQDPDNEEEQEAVADMAMLLINCIVDLVQHRGVKGMQAMVEGGIWLRPQDAPRSVCGNVPEGNGGGKLLGPRIDEERNPAADREDDKQYVCVVTVSLPGEGGGSRA